MPLRPDPLRRRPGVWAGRSQRREPRPRPRPRTGRLLKALAGHAIVSVAALVDDCWRTVDTADATLATDADRSILADESRLKQLFENLIRNAVEHGSAEVTVTVGTFDDGFYVEDDGPGIPEGERDDVFDAGSSTSEGGSGFGLSIVEQIAEAHGWHIDATEGSSGGARFEVIGVEFVDD